MGNSVIRMGINMENIKGSKTKGKSSVVNSKSVINNKVRPKPTAPLEKPMAQRFRPDNDNTKGEK